MINPPVYAAPPDPNGPPSPPFGVAIFAVNNASLKLLPLAYICS